MLDYILKITPVVAVVVIYFVRLEIRLTKICTDLDWIKKGCLGCQQNSEKDSD